jgi:hypothetical protein
MPVKDNAVAVLNMGNMTNLTHAKIELKRAIHDPTEKA